MSDFIVDTDEFSGPVGKLLGMIRNRKLYINDISLAKVTDAYLDHISENEESLDSMAEFVRIAATLVLAKSKALLPDNTSAEDEEEINQLEERLRAYRITKKRAEVLQEMYASSLLHSPREKRSQRNQDIFAPGNTLTVEKIVAAIAGCIIELPDSALETEEIEDTISLQEELDRLHSRCQEIEKTTFSRLSRSDNKHHQVVTFVAVLELVKANKLQAQQKEIFTTITISGNYD